MEIKRFLLHDLSERLVSRTSFQIFNHCYRFLLILLPELCRRSLTLNCRLLRLHSLHRIRSFFKKIQRCYCRQLSPTIQLCDCTLLACWLVFVRTMSFSYRFDYSFSEHTATCMICTVVTKRGSLLNCLRRNLSLNWLARSACHLSTK